MVGLHRIAQRELQELVGLPGYPCGVTVPVLGHRVCGRRDKQPLGTFFPFEFSLIVFLIDWRNMEASGTAQREKETCVGVVTSVGWALLPVLCSKGVGWLAQGLRHFPAAPFDARNSRNL